MTTPFAPKGHMPEWQMIYDGLLAAADFGDLITYEALDEALGRPFINDRGPLYKAREVLGEQRQRWLTAVTGQGYRVIEANEHMAVATQHKRKAKRQLITMVTVAKVTDLTKLTAAELANHDVQHRLNVFLLQTVTSHEARLQRLERIAGVLDSGGSPSAPPRVGAGRATAAPAAATGE